jgi:hypothetical protein
VERDEGSGRISTSRRLNSGKVKLRWGVSAVRHGEGLGAFYRALDAVERPGCDGEWWPSVGLKSFDFGRRRDGVASIQGGKMSGVGPGVERGDVGGRSGGRRHATREALRRRMESVVAAATSRLEEDDDSLRAGTGPKRLSGPEAKWAASAGWDK